MKQAYFRTDTNQNINSLLFHFSKIEQALIERTEIQESLFKEALNLTENEGHSTPRFLSPRGLEMIEEIDLVDYDET